MKLRSLIHRLIALIRFEWNRVIFIDTNGKEWEINYVSTDEHTSQIVLSSHPNPTVNVGKGVI